MIRVNGLMTPQDTATIVAALEKLVADEGRSDASGPQELNLDAAPQLRAFGDAIEKVLSAHEQIRAVFLPKVMARPVFLRMPQGTEFAWHTDPAVAGNGQQAIRTDVSAVIMLSDPSDYEGGELLFDGRVGSGLRPAAGDALIFPSSKVRGISQVTAGVRLSASVSIQSIVRDAAKREILADLGRAAGLARAERPASEEVMLLTRAHGNLMRQWAEL